MMGRDHAGAPDDGKRESGDDDERARPTPAVRQSARTMKRFVLPGVFIAAGIAFFVLGYSRSESVVGVADRVGTKVANAWDGRMRQPKQVMYYAAGAALLAIGAVLVRRGQQARR